MHKGGKEQKSHDNAFQDVLQLMQHISSASPVKHIHARMISKCKEMSNIILIIKFQLRSLK